MYFLISRINTQGYPQVEPAFPQLILSVVIVIMTALILVCGVIGGIILSKETVSFAAIFFTVFSGIMIFFLLIYAPIILGTDNPLCAIFEMGDFAGFGFGLTAIFYAVCIFFLREKRWFHHQNSLCYIWSLWYLRDYALYYDNGSWKQD